jgi:hypothetical protein
MKTTIKLFSIVLWGLLITFAEIAPAQNYKAVKTDASYYFIDSASLEIIVGRIDSVASTGDETNYWAMRQIRQTDYSCFIPTGASWLGDITTEKPNGVFQFTLYPFSPPDSSDVFTIQSTSPIGGSWHFYNYHTINHYVEASVTQINEINFIGITDSVKTLSLQRKNASGQNIDDPINGQKILLSKNYGLIRLPKFDEFHTNLKFLDLCGKNNPVTGRTNLTFEEIFDFQPGDEFHTQYLYTPYVNYYPTDEGSVIQIILDKIESSSVDTVIYRIAECKNNIRRNGMSVPVYTRTIDTIMRQYILSDYNQLRSEPKEPYLLNDWMEYLSDNSMGMSANSFMYLTSIPWKLTDASGILWNWGSPDCWNYATFDDYGGSSFFYKGIGGPYYSWMGTNITFNYNKLVYYKKGSETWGTPLNCDSLLQVGTEEYDIKEDVKFYPNPTTGKVTITLPAATKFPCELRLTDISGRVADKYILSSNTQFIDITNLKPGLYFARLVYENELMYIGKIMKQ